MTELRMFFHFAVCSMIGGATQAVATPGRAHRGRGATAGRPCAFILELMFLKTRFLKTGWYHFTIPPLHGNTREAAEAH